MLWYRLLAQGCRVLTTCSYYWLICKAIRQIICHHPGTLDGPQGYFTSQ